MFSRHCQDLLPTSLSEVPIQIICQRGQNVVESLCHAHSDMGFISDSAAEICFHIE